jgi:hypothetical protein
LTVLLHGFARLVIRNDSFGVPFPGAVVLVCLLIPLGARGSRRGKDSAFG